MEREMLARDVCPHDYALLEAALSNLKAPRFKASLRKVLDDNKQFAEKKSAPAPKSQAEVASGANSGRSKKKARV